MAGKLSIGYSVCRTGSRHSGWRMSPEVECPSGHEKLGDGEAGWLISSRVRAPLMAKLMPEM